MISYKETLLLIIFLIQITTLIVGTIYSINAMIIIGVIGIFIILILIPMIMIKPSHSIMTQNITQIQDIDTSIKINPLSYINK